MKAILYQTTPIIEETFFMLIKMRIFLMKLSKNISLEFKPNSSINEKKTKRKYE